MYQYFKEYIPKRTTAFQYFLQQQQQQQNQNQNKN